MAYTVNILGDGTTKGLWRVDTETSAEPSTDSADWTLLYETV